MEVELYVCMCIYVYVYICMCGDEGPLRALPDGRRPVCMYISMYTYKEMYACTYKEMYT